MKDYLTVKDIAERLDVTAETVRRWLRSGKLKGTPFGRAGYRVEEADFQALLHAGSAAGQMTNSTARFLKLTATLSQALTAKQVADVIIRQGLVDLQANGGVLFLLNEQRTVFTALHIVGYPQAIVDAWPGFPADAPLPIADAVRERKVVFFESLEERRKRYPHMAYLKVPGGDGALVALPVLLRDQPVGGLGFNFPHDRTLGEDERAFLLMLAELCAQALERVRIYEELQHTNRAFRTLIETMPVGVVVTDTGGAITFTNPIADTILHDGSRGDASPSANGFKLYRMDGSSSLSDELPLKWAIEQGHPDRNVDVMIKRDNGTEVAALVSGAPVVEEDGTIRSGVMIIQDITERKRVEMELQRSEERFQLAAEAVHALIYDWDVKTDYVHRSQGLFTPTGYRPEEVESTRQWWQQRIHPEDRQRVADLIKSVFNDQHQYEYSEEYRILHKNNQYIYVRDHGVILRDENGYPVRVVGSTFDITSYKQAEIALQENEERMRLAANVAKLGMWDRDLLKDRLVWTDQCKALFGLPADSVMSFERYLSSVHPEDRELVEQTIKLGLSEQTEFSAEYRIIWPDKGIHWVAARGRSIFDEQGRPVRTIGVILDITERKRTEEALQRSEQHFRLLADAMPQIVWTAEPNGRVDYYNQQGYKYTGYSQEDLLRQNWWEILLHPEEIESIAKRWKTAITSGEVYETECRLKDRATGGYRWFLTRALPLRDEYGRITKWFGTCTDIDEQKRLEKELTARAGQMEAIFQAMADGITVCDSTGHIQQINRAYRELFELEGDLDSFVSVPLERGKWLVPRTPGGELLPQDQWPLFRALRGEVLAGPQIMDILCNTRRGRHIIINSGGAPIRDASGNVIGAVAVFRDVTERKRIEAALQASEERYRTIVQTANEGIWLIDTQARTVFVNDRMAAMLGYRAAEMLERSAFEFVFTDNQLETKALIDSVLQGSFEQFETTLRRKDGSILSIWASTSPVRDGSGTIVGALGMFVDITERKRLEQRTHQALDALLAMAERLVAFHPSSEEEYTRSATTERVRHMADLTRHALDCEGVVIGLFAPSTEIVEHIITSGFEATDEQALQDLLQGTQLSDGFDDPHIVTSLRAGEIQVLDVTQSPYRERLPRPHLRHALLVPLRLGSDLLGVISLYPNTPLHDFTAEETALADTVGKLAALVIERERLLHEREEARANQLALQETTRRMDEFIGIVSHELRTPLTAIKGNIQLAKRQLTRLLKQDGAESDERSSTITTVEEQLERADRQIGTQNRLVNDLLDVSRIQANHLELHLDWCDLVAIVRGTIEDQRALAPSRSIHFESNVEAVDAFVDAERVEQVVHNYVSNALKYSEPARPVDVRLVKEEAFVRVLVRDEGPGLAQEEQQRIWDRFYRVPGVKVQSGSGVGMGLGLHICRTLIEQLGGQVGVESTPGQGSTFWFTLPFSSL